MGSPLAVVLEIGAAAAGRAVAFAQRLGGGHGALGEALAAGEVLGPGWRRWRCRRSAGSTRSAYGATEASVGTVRGCSCRRPVTGGRALPVGIADRCGGAVRHVGGGCGHCRFG